MSCKHTDVEQYGKGRLGFYFCHACRSEVDAATARKSWLRADSAAKRGVWSRDEIDAAKRLSEDNAKWFLAGQMQVQIIDGNVQKI